MRWWWKFANVTAAHPTLGRMLLSLVGCVLFRLRIDFRVPTVTDAVVLEPRRRLVLGVGRL